MNLSMSTSDRLRLAADIIEKEPAKFDMHHYYSKLDGRRGPEQIAGAKTIECGTTCCVAGWGVVLSPPSLIAGIGNWYDAGAKAFGFQDGTLAFKMFLSNFDVSSGDMAACLRALADIPVRQRRFTNDDVQTILSRYL